MRLTTAWGWAEPFKSAFATRGKIAEQPARVIEELRGAYLVQTETGELSAEISGRLRHQAKHREDFPTVGDWVAIKPRPMEKSATILAILPRTSKLSRKSSGQETDEQVLAANLDTVFVVTSLNRDFNARRLERYLALVAESGAAAVVLLSKADLCPDPEAAAQELRAVVGAVPVIPISALSGLGFTPLNFYFEKGQTIAVIGSSGVGKSTLINRLTGSDRQTVQAVRETDDRGRHTTTSRRLIPLAAGGFLIDTPGMRELQVWETTGISDTFADITSLFAACRFGNCRHETDAGCAIQDAIQNGRLSAERYAHYLKLNSESAALADKREAEAIEKDRQKIRKARTQSAKETS